MSYTHFDQVSGKNGLGVGAKGSEIALFSGTGMAALPSQFIKGQKFVVGLPSFAAADIGVRFFVAPAPCKVISATEVHSTVAGQAGTMKIELLLSGDEPANGNVCITTAFDLASTANTPVTVTDVIPTYQNLVAGSSLSTLLASGAATSLAGASLSVVMEWT